MNVMMLLFAALTILVVSEISAEKVASCKSIRKGKECRKSKSGCLWEFKEPTSKWKSCRTDLTADTEAAVNVDAECNAFPNKRPCEQAGCAWSKKMGTEKFKSCHEQSESNETPTTEAACAASFSKARKCRNAGCAWEKLGEEKFKSCHEKSFFGVVTAATSSPVAASATTIQLDDVDGIEVNDLLTISDGTNSESATVSGVTEDGGRARRATAGRVTVATALVNAYGRGAAVEITASATISACATFLANSKCTNSPTVRGESDVTIAGSAGGNNKPTCYKGKTFAEAGDICRRAGARLCTSGEIEDGAAAHTGCNFDSKHVWTSTSCASGKHVTKLGVGGGSCGARNRKSKEKCSSDSYKSKGVRCCEGGEQLSPSPFPPYQVTSFPATCVPPLPPCKEFTTYTREQGCDTKGFVGSGPGAVDGIVHNYSTSVVVPRCTDTIGPEAFAGCSALTSISIPSTVTKIGNHAFEGTAGLAAITIPDEVTDIGDNAFSEAGLTSVSIGASVTRIGDYAFQYQGYHNEGGGLLGHLIIPDTVTDIGYSAFYGAYAFAYNNCLGPRANKRGICKRYDETTYASTSLTLGASVTNIGEEAFSYCPFRTVAIPDSTKVIGESAFYNCFAMTTFSIGNSVTEIADHTFSGCSALTSVTIPDGITKIGNNAFYRCKAMTSVSIGASVIELGDSAFSECANLTSITIGNSVTHLGKDVFKYVWTMTDLTIPNSVISIGESAFEGMFGLTSITIPDSVTEVGADIFYEKRLENDCQRVNSHCREQLEAMPNKGVYTLKSASIPAALSGQITFPTGCTVTVRA